MSDPELSPALSQVGAEWPVDGRIIALLVDENSDLETVVAVRDKIFDAGMVPLILGPHGGTIGDGDDAVTVQRTYLTARSIEFDAILLSGGRFSDRRGQVGSTGGDSAERNVSSQQGNWWLWARA